MLAPVPFPVKGFPLEFCNGRGAQKWNDAPTRLPERQNDVMMSIRLEAIGWHWTDRRYTDGIGKIWRSAWHADARDKNCSRIFRFDEAATLLS